MNDSEVRNAAFRILFPQINLQRADKICASELRALYCNPCSLKAYYNIRILKQDADSFRHTFFLLLHRLNL